MSVQTHVQTHKSCNNVFKLKLSIEGLYEKMSRKFQFDVYCSFTMTALFCVQIKHHQIPRNRSSYVRKVDT